MVAIYANSVKFLPTELSFKVPSILFFLDLNFFKGKIMEIWIKFKITEFPPVIFFGLKFRQLLIFEFFDLIFPYHITSVSLDGILLSLTLVRA